MLRKLVLIKTGYEVVTANSGLEAWELHLWHTAQNHKPRSVKSPEVRLKKIRASLVVFQQKPC
jgi:hypothetical protein